MRSYQRQNILSAALDLPPGREVTRDTLEAAIRALCDPSDSDLKASLLLSVIDAYTDSRSRRAIYAWMEKNPGTMPSTAIDMAQSAATRRVLQSIAGIAARQQTASQPPYAAPQAVPSRITYPRSVQRQSERNVTERRYTQAPQPRSQPQPQPTQRSTSIFGSIAAASIDAATIAAEDAAGITYQSGAVSGSLGDTHVQDEPVKPVSVPQSEGIPDELPDDPDVKYRCTKCGRDWPRSGFHRSSAVKRGFENQCKLCKNAQSAASRNRRKQREREAAAMKTLESLGNSAAS